MSPSCSRALSSTTFTRRSSRLALWAISEKSFTAFTRFSVSWSSSSWKRSSLGRSNRMTLSTFFMGTPSSCVTGAMTFRVTLA